MDERIEIGQHLFTGFPGLHITPAFAQRMRESKIGNVILFAHNVGTAGQLRRLCADIQELVTQATGYPAFIAIDQEGGVVSRLGKDCTIVPGAMAIAATGKPENAYSAGLITGRELRAMGVNFNLAPVVDINSNPDNPVIGVRSYGEDPRQVIRYGLQMARGLMDAGILCCAKHFPGHGDAAVDSHIGLPLVNKSPEELLTCELLPFQAAVDAGIPGIMSTHILFPQLEPEKIPATMSRRIMTDLLKKRMGFKGLVLSDCMMMGAIANHYGTVNGMVAALKAGVDLMFASHRVELAAQASNRMLEELREGRINAEELKASTSLILRYKACLMTPKASEFALVGSMANRQQAAAMYEQSLTAVHLPQGRLPALGERPLFIGCLPFTATQASSPNMAKVSFADAMKERFGGETAIMSENPDQKEVERIAALAPGHSSITIGTYNGHLRTGQLDVVRALARSSAPVICIALRNPYDLAGLPPQVSTVAAYAYNESTLHAIMRLMSGEIDAAGVLPVTLKG